MLRRRLAKQLGLEPGEVRLLADRARARLGSRGYALRVFSFALATAPVVRLALPSAIRLRAIRPLLYALMPGAAENLLYVSGGPGGSGEERRG